MCVSSDSTDVQTQRTKGLIFVGRASQSTDSFICMSAGVQHLAGVQNPNTERDGNQPVWWNRQLTQESWTLQQAREVKGQNQDVCAGVCVWGFEECQMFGFLLFFICSHDDFPPCSSSFLLVLPISCGFLTSFFLFKLWHIFAVFFCICFVFSEWRQRTSDGVSAEYFRLVLLEDVPVEIVEIVLSHSSFLMFMAVIIEKVFKWMDGLHCNSFYKLFLGVNVLVIIRSRNIKNNKFCNYKVQPWLLRPIRNLLSVPSDFLCSALLHFSFFNATFCHLSFVHFFSFSLFISFLSFLWFKKNWASVCVCVCVFYSS